MDIDKKDKTRSFRTKGHKGHILALCFLEDLSRVESREGLSRIVSDFYEL